MIKIKKDNKNGSKKPQAAIDRAKIYEMRQSGVTLREIGEKFGITRERIRQILVYTYGSTHHNLISTAQLSLLIGLATRYIMMLYDNGILKPAYTYDINGQQRLMWSVDTIKVIKEYYSSSHICCVCKRPILPNRKYYCSDHCRREKYRHKNLSPENKQWVIARQLLYREKERLKNQ